MRRKIFFTTMFMGCVTLLTGKALDSDLKLCFTQPASKSYNQHRERHVSDYQELFCRVSLNLVTAPNLPTIDRLNAHKNGASDNALEAWLFQYGRYLLISSSRSGSLSANLREYGTKLIEII